MNYLYHKGNCNLVDVNNVKSVLYDDIISYAKKNRLEKKEDTDRKIEKASKKNEKKRYIYIE